MTRRAATSTEARRGARASFLSYGAALGALKRGRARCQVAEPPPPRPQAAASVILGPPLSCRRAGPAAPTADAITTPLARLCLTATAQAARLAPLSPTRRPGRSASRGGPRHGAPGRAEGLCGLRRVGAPAGRVKGRACGTTIALAPAIIAAPGRLTCVVSLVPRGPTPRATYILGLLLSIGASMALLMGSLPGKSGRHAIESKDAPRLATLLPYYLYMPFMLPPCKLLLDTHSPS